MLTKCSPILTKFLHSSKKSVYSFSSSRIPRPRDPTVAESFETTISPQQVDILMDPKGFMSEQQKAREQENMPKQSYSKQVVNGKQMAPEFGFKPKGPEPTRYGDWDIKGKCVDF